MRMLDDKFALEVETTSQRTANEQKRRIECKFEAQCRDIKSIVIKREPVIINPVADALKGLSINV